MLARPMELADSRRLTGPNLYWDRPGAVLDVRLPEPLAEAAIAEWRAAVERALAAVGWSGEATRVRRFHGGASLVISAPFDTLYAATEVNEWAFASANAALGGPPAPAAGEAAVRLRALIASEAKPALRALAARAESAGVTLLVDEELVSVGTGTGVRTFPLSAIPEPDAIDWAAVHDVPTVLVTGSNGKTTTARLLTAVLAGTGRSIGMCCSDHVRVAGEILDRGDWSGPGGARMVLRDPRVDLAVLETARGGMLRRGLAVRRADAAIITNVAEDHFGEFGINDLGALAEAKFVVTRTLGPGGHLVLNGDDPQLRARASAATAPIIWLTIEPENPLVQAHIQRGGEAGMVEGDRMLLVRDGERTEIATLAEVPITFGGRARHNVANAMGVAALAAALRVEAGVIRRGLRNFGGTAGENPGRLNCYELGGVSVIVDFAHNPHGMRALVALAATLPARRRLIVIGQAGDRDDQAVRELARSAWMLSPDRILLKEMEKYLRGRARGETTALLREELVRAGAPAESIGHADTEYAAVQEALAWARRGDLLVLPVHAERERVLGLLERLQHEGWRPGAPLPV